MAFSLLLRFAATSSLLRWALGASALALCLMFSLLHSHLSLSHPSGSILAFAYPLLSILLRWESVFSHVGGGRSRRVHPPHLWAPEAPEDGERLAAELSRRSWHGNKASVEIIVFGFRVAMLSHIASRTKRKWKVGFESCGFKILFQDSANVSVEI